MFDWMTGLLYGYRLVRQLWSQEYQILKKFKRTVDRGKRALQGRKRLYLNEADDIDRGRSCNNK